MFSAHTKQLAVVPVAAVQATCINASNHQLAVCVLLVSTSGITVKQVVLHAQLDNISLPLERPRACIFRQHVQL